MSYPRDIDELSDSELHKELKRRLMLRVRGRCDYCMRPFKVCNAQPCKLPRRPDVANELKRGYGPGGKYCKQHATMATRRAHAHQ